MLYNGFVYLAKSDTGHYKIGRSQNPYGRIKHFDTIMPVKVKIVHYFPCDDPALGERALHYVVKESRITGEWFDLSDGDVESVCRITHLIDNYAYMITDNGLEE